MDQETRELMNLRVKMMETPAWAELVAEWEQLREVSKSVEGIETAENFWRAKGFVDALNLMLRLEELTQQTLEADDAV